MCVENIMLALAAEGLFGCIYTPYESLGLKEFLGVAAGLALKEAIISSPDPFYKEAEHRAG